MFAWKVAQTFRGIWKALWHKLWHGNTLQIPGWVIRQSLKQTFNINSFAKLLLTTQDNKKVYLLIVFSFLFGNQIVTILLINPIAGYKNNCKKKQFFDYLLQVGKYSKRSSSEAYDVQNCFLTSTQQWIKQLHLWSKQEVYYLLLHQHKL